MVESNDNHFKIECSDDENYGNYEDNYRTINGKKIWEPMREQIGSLYQQLESKGFIELRWQCPGRRSPSVHSINNSQITHKLSDLLDNECNLQNDKNNELNEFDFETEFNNESSITSKVSQPQRRRSNQGIKKSQTNLNKVMQDIKKYKLIDQQSKQLSLQTVSTSLIQNTTPFIVSTTSSTTTQSSTESHPQTN